MCARELLKMPPVHTYTDDRDEWRHGRLQRYQVAGDKDMKEREETSGRGKMRRALTRASGLYSASRPSLCLTLKTRNYVSER